jgi:hypothetical protein
VPADGDSKLDGQYDIIERQADFPVSVLVQVERRV